MSNAGDILSGLEIRIPALLTGFQKARYFYNLQKNDSQSNTKSFRVYPEDGETAGEQTTRTITKSQKFTVSLTTDFFETNDSDIAIREAVEALNSAIEIVQKDAMASRFNIGRINVVNSFTFSAPEIDLDSKTVSINTTFTITYRMV